MSSLSRTSGSCPCRWAAAHLLASACPLQHRTVCAVFVTAFSECTDCWRQRVCTDPVHVWLMLPVLANSRQQALNFHDCCCPVIRKLPIGHCQCGNLHAVVHTQQPAQWPWQARPMMGCTIEFQSSRPLQGARHSPAGQRSCSGTCMPRYERHRSVLVPSAGGHAQPVQ